MKRLLKMFSLILALSVLALALVSCGSADTTASRGTELPTPPQHYTELPFTDEVGEIRILGTPISEYRVVIPSDADLYTRCAAQNVVDYLKYNADITLRTVTDATKAVEHELIIGATDREGSRIAAATELGEDEFILMRSGGSVVIYGESYMVGGGAGKLLSVCAGPAWRGLDVDITELPSTPTPERFEFTEAKNAVYLIADGFGENHVNAALAAGLSHFSGLDLPFRGESVTSSLSVIEQKATATDSAAGGTALATGYKTYNGYIGVNGEGIPIPSLRELAHESGARTSLLTTDAVDATTISSFLVHIADRDLKEQIRELQSQVIENGEVTLVTASVGNRMLTEAPRHLYTVSAHGSRFFSMIEEGAIDSVSHDNDMAGLLSTVTRFHELIGYCVEFVLLHPDTALVITADHETGGIRYVSAADRYIFTSQSHSNVNVPVYAMGWGCEYFDGATVDNTDVAKFIAKIYGEENFGRINE